MSDRIAVFNDGRIEQIGTAAEIYERPATAFVAGFVGTTNLLRGRAAVRVVGAPGTYSIRPERIRIAAPAGPDGMPGPAASGARRARSPRSSTSATPPAAWCDLDARRPAHRGRG